MIILVTQYDNISNLLFSAKKKISRFVYTLSNFQINIISTFFCKYKAMKI